MRNTFRIVIPTQVDFFFILFKNIVAKHLVDGANSVLNIIDMADAQAKLQIAITNHDNAESFKKSAQIATQLRNRALGLEADQKSHLEDSLLYLIASVRDLLLGHLRGKEPTLSEWGFVVSVNQKGAYRIPLPYRKPLDLIALCKKILAKHLADGASSALQSLDMIRFAALLSVAEQQQTNSEQLHNKKEIAYKNRNNALGFGKKRNSSIEGNLQFYVRAIRNALLGKYRSNVQALGDWGFEVNRSPRKGKELTIL